MAQSQATQSALWTVLETESSGQAGPAVISLTILLSPIAIILIKRCLEATVVLQDAKIIAETSSINGNY